MLNWHEQAKFVILGEIMKDYQYSEKIEKFCSTFFMDNLVYDYEQAVGQVF